MEQKKRREAGGDDAASTDVGEQAVIHAGGLGFRAQARMETEGRSPQSRRRPSGDRAQGAYARSPPQDARAADQDKRDRDRDGDPHPARHALYSPRRRAAPDTGPPAREGRVRRGGVHRKGQDRVGAVEEAGFGGGVRAAGVVDAEGVGGLGEGDGVGRLGVAAGGQGGR